MKGLFIPGITAEMFRNGCLESIEELMAEGEFYDIDYPETQEKKGIWIVETDCEGKTRTIKCPFCGWKSGQYQWKDEKFCAGCGKAMEVRDIWSLRESLS